MQQIVKRLLYTSLTLCFLFLFTGCNNKETCAYCGETKHCKEYDLVGITRWICDDCIQSGNSTSVAILEEYGITIPEETENTDNTDDIVPEEEINTPPAPVFTVEVTKDGLLTSLGEYFRAFEMQLVASETKGNTYDLYAGDTYEHISFVFTPVAEGMVPPLSVVCYEGVTINDYTKACIAASLCYTGSNDFSGMGYEIYNNTTTYGSYILGNARFYYKAFSKTDVENGAPSMTFDISRQ